MFRTTPAPSPYKNVFESRDYQSTDPAGPYGWCEVEPYKVDNYLDIYNSRNLCKSCLQGDKVDGKSDDKFWGFCSRTCDLPNMQPFDFHQFATIDILPSSKCNEWVEPWSRDHVLCVYKYILDYCTESSSHPQHRSTPSWSCAAVTKYSWIRIQNPATTTWTCTVATLRSKWTNFSSQMILILVSQQSYGSRLRVGSQSTSKLRKMTKGNF